MLSVERLDVAYGGSQVLWGVDLKVPQGEVVCLMGRNGVGKTTVLRAIMGLLPVRAGRIVLGGQDITRWPSDRRARAGLGYVPQGREIFPHLSVEENLRMALLGCERATSIDDALDLFPALKRFLSRKGGVLSGGEQQMLTMGRTLMGDPELVIIDEPTEGLAPMLVTQVGRFLDEIARRGVSILLVEQKLTIALKISHRVYVMGHGRIVFEGTPAALAANAAVRKENLEV
jgi:branched-chain amino acid transport system ATP-binding protein